MKVFIGLILGIMSLLFVLPAPGLGQVSTVNPVSAGEVTVNVFSYHYLA